MVNQKLDQKNYARKKNVFFYVMISSGRDQRFVFWVCGTYGFFSQVILSRTRYAMPRNHWILFGVAGKRGRKPIGPDEDENHRELS
jgi:hypothetical protein